MTQLSTRSGRAITIGAGSGTAWKDVKRGDPSNTEGHNQITDRLVFSIKTGYNNLDSAEAYTTHPEVGRAIEHSGVPREDLWVATKYSAYSEFIQKKAFNPHDFVEQALAELNTDYLDLLLIHHPFFDKDKSNYDLELLWKEIVDVHKLGKVRYIGVSNFAVNHLEQIIAVSNRENGALPVVNQIEFHPYLQNQSPGIREFAKANNIAIQGYGPLTPLFRINDAEGHEVAHPLQQVLPDLANKYGRTEAQILLRYTLQKDVLPITISSKEQRIHQAFEVYDFVLEDADVALIDIEGSKFPYRAFFKKQF